MSGRKKLTASTGAPVPDNQSSLTAGQRGPLPMQDRMCAFLKNSHTSTVKSSPSNVCMHAKGSGAFGTCGRFLLMFLSVSRTQTPFGFNSLRRFVS